MVQGPFPGESASDEDQSGGYSRRQRHSGAFKSGGSRKIRMRRWIPAMDRQERIPAIGKNKNLHEGEQALLCPHRLQGCKGQYSAALPNPHRSDNYFNGGVVYEVPSGNDHFILEVSPPFGKGTILVYASPSRREIYPCRMGAAAFIRSIPKSGTSG